MATYEDDIDFYDEEEPEITQNLALLQSILQQNQDQNALQKQQSSGETLKTINPEDIREKRRTVVPMPESQTQDQQEDSVSYDVESFIIEMECYHCLWNTSTRSHHDQNMRINAWEKLSRKFGKTGQCVIFIKLPSLPLSLNIPAANINDLL